MEQARKNEEALKAKLAQAEAQSRQIEDLRRQAGDRDALLAQVAALQAARDDAERAAKAAQAA